MYKVSSLHLAVMAHRQGLASLLLEYLLVLDPLVEVAPQADKDRCNPYPL